MKRRKFMTGLLGGVAAGVTGISHAGSKAERQPTPPEIEGPFYPVVAQKDKDFDLTQVKGRSGRAKGRVIEIVGRVLDQHGNPVEDALVDLWQANAAGRYRHPNDPNKAPLDPDFQGWAMVPSGKDGGFRFKTIFPGVYPASPTWDRPPHIHYKISKRGYVDITTQMYFPDHKLNDKDLLLLRKTPAERKLMIARIDKKNPNRFYYDIVLQKV